VGTQPEVMRDQIADTRQELSTDLEALNDKMNPQKVYERKVESAKGRAAQAKEKLMGAKEEAAGTAHSAEKSVQQKAEGHPLLAGAVAFGAGYLLSGLLPATKAEQQAGGAVKEKAEQHKDQLKQEAASSANDVKSDAQDSASSAAGEVKKQAQESAQHLKDETDSAKQQVAGQAKSATEETKSEAQHSAQHVKGTTQS
jgi:hypothetical protein